MKAEAARTHQSGAEYLRRAIGKLAGKSGTDLLPAEQRANEVIFKGRVLVGDEFALPGAFIPADLPDTVAPDRLEIGTAP